VLLTEKALEVFESERERETNERTWTSERRGWLALAKGVAAPDTRVARLDAAPPSEAVVGASKDLYLATAERAVRTAKRDKRWDQVARIRRGQAAALYRASGSAIPPPDEIVALHRAWSEAALRSHMAFGKQVELVAAGCCAICERDSGRAFRVAAELRAQRLPHAGCPKGLCACDWRPLPDSIARGQRVRRRASLSASPAAAPVAELAPLAEPEFEHPRGWYQIRAENWPRIIVVSTIAVEIASLVNVDPLVRGPLVLWFSLFCTGMAWVHLLRIREPLAEAVTAIALSVALSGLTAAAFLYAGLWSPSWTMVVLEAITLVGVMLSRVLARPLEP
jgi:hypothetical protein